MRPTMEFVTRFFPLAMFLAATLATHGGVGLAQCPQDDTAEPNDSCVTPLPGTMGTTTGLVVTLSSRDWWLYSVPPGQTLTIDVLFSNYMANLDLLLYTDPGACGTLVDFSQSNTDDEQVTYTNSTASPTSVKLGVIFSEGPDQCGEYTIITSLSPDSCIPQPDDAWEDNDSCASAVALPMFSTLDLWIRGADEDYYSVTLNAGDELTLLFGYPTTPAPPGTPANLLVIDSQVLDASDCSTILSDSHQFFPQQGLHEYTNTTGAPQDVVVRVFMHAAADVGCSEYSLNPQITSIPCLAAADDGFEDNDSCSTATAVTTGLYSGLRAIRRDLDVDWYTLTLPQGATITVDLLFPHAVGDIDCYLWSDCDGYLTSAFSNTDNEQLRYSNAQASPITVMIEVFVTAYFTSGTSCTDYDMNIAIEGGSANNIDPYCFGDGSGTPCPCGNNSNAGHAGGCAHSNSFNAKGGLLSGAGTPSVAQDTLSFRLNWAEPNSFALLLSGVNRLPQMGGCAGCGIPAFDGLRCAGGSLLRHGTRSISVGGIVNQDWGGPSGGLIAANGFSAGSTRHFFAMFRTDPTEACQGGQNSSNGLSVTFLP